MKLELPKNQPLVQEEVNKLHKKGVAVECEHEAGEYFSPIFLRERANRKDTSGQS